MLQQFEHRGLKFGLFLPSKWEPSGPSGKYPVIVFLHGRGESGGFAVTNAQSLPWLLAGNNASFASGFPFIVLAPQCPQECAMENGWQKSVQRGTAELVQEWVTTDLGGDPHRVYLTGQSMGGHGAWQSATHLSDRAVAVASATEVASPTSAGGETRRSSDLKLQMIQKMRKTSAHVRKTLHNN